MSGCLHGYFVVVRPFRLRIQQSRPSALKITPSCSQIYTFSSHFNYYQQRNLSTQNKKSNRSPKTTQLLSKIIINRHNIPKHLFICIQQQRTMIQLSPDYSVMYTSLSGRTSYQLFQNIQFSILYTLGIFICKLTIFYRNMKESQTPKEFSDTADSFKNINEFNYHHKQGQCNYKILLENQVQDILNIFQDTPPTKIQVQDFIRGFQKETDLMINELLSETAQIRKKLRNQHDVYEYQIRQQKSKFRKLAEQNIYLTANLQVSEKSLRKQVQSLQKELKEERQSSHSEIKGLKSLLAEYEKQLQQKTNQIQKLQEECHKSQSLYEEAKIQIVTQSRQISQLKQACAYLTNSLEDQECFLKVHENQRIDMIINQQELFTEKMKEKKQQIYLLASSEKELQQKINAMTLTIEQLKKQVVCAREERMKGEERQRQMKEKFRIISQKAIRSIKGKYQLKITKINDLMKKELKKAKKEIETLKVSVLKQIGLCFKETKGGIFSQMIALKN